MLLAVGILVFGMTGQAMADLAFKTGDLIRIAYGVNASDGKSYEYATDLGNFASLTSPISATTLLSANPINFGTFGSTPVSGLTVAYYMVTNTAYGDASNQVWASGALATGQWSGSRKWAGFASNSSANLLNYQGSAAGTNNATITVAPLDNSYETKFGTGGTLGTYINTTQHPGTGADASLAALATLGYVDQYLYYYDPSQNTTTYAGGQATYLIATIRTFANGTTELLPNAAPVPIPAAVYLLGSGLLGLIGIRRRMMA